MAQSKNFSIFLLKENFNEENALKADHRLGDPVTDAKHLPQGATLYIDEPKEKNPWWKSYWGIQQDLKQTLCGAIVFIPVESHCFAITFGHTYHNLLDESYEYDFGLKTALNCFDPDKLKSTDILQPETSKRSRIQAPIAADLTFFDINRDESIIKKMSGKVLKEYQEIFRNITGANSVKICSKVQADGIAELCKKLLVLYLKDDYKKNFPDIQNIVPVKDPSEISSLNDELIKVFGDAPKELVLTVPEIIEDEPLSISYKVGREKGNIYDDVLIYNYRQELETHGQSDISIETLKKHRLNMQDENGNVKHVFSIYKCLLFDCNMGDEYYHLCEGEWYRIDKEYCSKLNHEIDTYFTQYDILQSCNEKYESGYNDKIATINDGVYCLDMSNIAPPKQTQVEPCDIFCVKDSVNQLIHIKISTKSAPLSHLFNQGLNSVELIRVNSESKGKFMELLRQKNCSDFQDNDKYAVIYGIITTKGVEKKSEALPIFSRISFRRCSRILKSMGIACSIVLIPDKVDRKKLEKETKSK